MDDYKLGKNSPRFEVWHIDENEKRLRFDACDSDALVAHEAAERLARQHRFCRFAVFDKYDNYRILDGIHVCEVPR